MVFNVYKCCYGKKLLINFWVEFWLCNWLYEWNDIKKMYLKKEIDICGSIKIRINVICVVLVIVF